MEIDVETATPKDFVAFIDSKFDELVGKISRVDLKWGQWSVIMNKEIRSRIDANVPSRNDLILVYNYWIVMSQLLEQYYRYKKNGRVYKIFNKRRLVDKISEAKNLREIMSI